MLVHDEIYRWEGWGGSLRLGSGQCRLRIIDLEKSRPGGVTYLRPIIVVVSDVPESKMSVKSCTSHIATGVARKFKIDHHRMLYVEYYPPSMYGERREHLIEERFDAVEFAWHDDKAIQPKWRALESPLRDVIRQYL